MSQSINFPPFKLDPWAASSLLQKAIRRGEVQLAQRAAAILHRFRGNGIFRRFSNIAIEDVGIGDLDLVCEVTRLSIEPKLRLALGSEARLIDDLCAKLAFAPKDRSVDYLYCAATKLETALADREQFQRESCAEQVALASDPDEPLARRAVAALLVATTGNKAQQKRGLEQLFASSPRPSSPALHEMLMSLARSGRHPFALMLLLIHSRLELEDLPTRVVYDPLPSTEFVHGVPLYTFDKHTSVGKGAIRKLAEECSELRRVLNVWVPKDEWANSVLMAAFYADAAPVRKRREWSAGTLLWLSGFQADMKSAGCPYNGAQPLLECVRKQLGTLNDLRRWGLHVRPSVR